MKQMLKYILGLLTTQQHYLEQKHSTILAINSGIIVLTVGFFTNSGPLVLLLNFVTLFLCGVSLAINLLALYSRVIKIKKPHIQSLEKCNMLYFGNIVYFSEEEYLKRIHAQYNFPPDLEYDDFDKDLSRQIIITSKVTYIKHTLFNKSLLFLISGLISSIIMFAIISLGV